MHEQANKCVLGLLVDIFEQLGQRQEVVVVDPDEIARLPDTREFFSKRLVGSEVSFPVRLLRRDLSCDILPEQVVEKGPKCWGGKEEEAWSKAAFSQIFSWHHASACTHWFCSNPHSVHGRSCRLGILGRRSSFSSVRRRCSRCLHLQGQCSCRSQLRG
jgi:hypothetical protein